MTDINKKNQAMLMNIHVVASTEITESIAIQNKGIIRRRKNILHRTVQEVHHINKSIVSLNQNLGGSLIGIVSIIRKSMSILLIIQVYFCLLNYKNKIFSRQK